MCGVYLGTKFMVSSVHGFVFIEAIQIRSKFEKENK